MGHVLWPGVATDLRGKHQTGLGRFRLSYSARVAKDEQKQVAIERLPIHLLARHRWLAAEPKPTQAGGWQGKNQGRKNPGTGTARRLKPARLHAAAGLGNKG